MVATRVSALLLVLSFGLSAQESVAPEFMYHRIWAVVPLIGKGTPEDPQRPMFVPSPSEQRADELRREKTAPDGEKYVERPAIIAYSMQVSDDKRSALVEFVGFDAKSLSFITESNASGVKVFEGGKATVEEVEAEFRKYKSEFTLDSLAGRKQ